MSELFPRIPNGELCVHRDHGVGIVLNSCLDDTEGVLIRYYRVLVEWPNNETTVAFSLDMDIKPYA